MSNIGDLASPRSKKEYNLSINLLSINNLKRKDDNYSLSSLFCECLADGNLVGRCENTEIPKGPSVNITLSHLFTCVVSDRSKVVITINSNQQGSQVLLGQGVVSVSEMEVGKQDFRFLNLKKKNKKEILGGEAQVMLNLSKRVSVSGPTTVTKPGKDVYLEEEGGGGGVGGGVVSRGDSGAKLISEGGGGGGKKNYQRSQSSGVLVKKSFASKFKSKQTPKKGGSMMTKKTTFDDKLLFQCIEYLSHPECLSSPGIFRISASHGEIRLLKEQFEEGHNISWDTREKYGSKNGVDVIAGLLIDLLLGMDEPLIPFNAYEGLMEAEACPEEEIRLRAFRSLINNVQPIYRSALAKVCHFLCAISGVEGNKMTVNNLGIVFGPVLMRGRNETPQSIVDDSPCIIRIICSLIDNYEFFFLGARPVLGLYDGKSQIMQDNPTSPPPKKEEKKEQEKTLNGEESVEERGLQRYISAQLSELEGLLEEVVGRFEKGTGKEREKWTGVLKKMMQLANNGPEKEGEGGGEGEEGGGGVGVGVMPVKGVKERVEQLKAFCGSVTELLSALISPSNGQATKYGIQIGEVLRQMISLISPLLGGEGGEGGAVRELREGQTVKVRAALKESIEGFVRPFSNWFETGIAQQKEVNLMLLAAEYLDIASSSLIGLDKHELLLFDPQRLAGPCDEILDAPSSPGDPSSPLLEEEANNTTSTKKLALNLPLSRHPSFSLHHPSSSRLPPTIKNLPPPPQTDRPAHRPPPFSPHPPPSHFPPPPHNLPPHPLATPPSSPPVSPTSAPPTPSPALPAPLPSPLPSPIPSPRGGGGGGGKGPAPPPPPPPLPPPSASDDIMLLKGSTLARLDKIKQELKNIQGSCSSAPRSVLVDQAGVVSALLVSFEKLKIFWEKKQRHQQGEE